MAKLTHGHTSQVENVLGSRVSARTIVSLARVFGVSVNWLLDGDGDAPTGPELKAAVAVARARCVAAGPDDSQAIAAVTVEAANDESERPTIKTKSSRPPPHAA